MRAVVENTSDPFWRTNADEIAALEQEWWGLYRKIQILLLGVSWRQVSSPDLVRLFQHAVATRGALDDAYPPSADDPDEAQRINRFLSMVVRCGVFLKHDHPDAIQHPLDFASKQAAGLVCRMPVWNEIRRRGYSHTPGFCAALIRLLATLRADGVTGLMLDDLENLSIAELGARVHSKLSKPQLRPILNRLANPGQDIAGQVVMTIEQRWGTPDPLQVLADALDGRLDIATTAVSNALQDESRKLRRREDTELTIGRKPSRLVHGKRRTVEDFDEITIEEETIEHQFDAEDLLLQFLLDHPRYEQGLEFERSDETDESLARAHRITRKTVIRHRQAAMKAYRAWLRQRISGSKSLLKNPSL